MKPWEFKPSNEVYVIEDDPLYDPDQTDGDKNSEENSEAKNKKQYDQTLEELKKRSEAQKRILLKREQEIIQKANLRAEYIINNANLRAKTEKETIIGDAMVEADKIRDNAFAMGYNEGFEKTKEELLGCTEKLNDSLQQIITNHEESLQQIKKDIEKISLAIAEKILQKQLEVDDFAMLNLIEELISENKQSSFIKVEISDQMEHLVDHVQTLFAKKYPQLSVSKANRPQGACIVDTPDGVIDASIQTQLENIRKAINPDYSKEK